MIPRDKCSIEEKGDEKTNLMDELVRVWTSACFVQGMLSVAYENLESAEKQLKKYFPAHLSSELQENKNSLDRIQRKLRKYAIDSQLKLGELLKRLVKDEKEKGK